MPQDSASRGLDKVIVRLPDGMRDRIAQAASAAGKSMNAVIVEALEREFPEKVDLNYLYETLHSLIDTAQHSDHEATKMWARKEAILMMNDIRAFIAKGEM